MDVKKIKKDAIEYIIPHWGDYDSLIKEPKIFVKGEGIYLYDIEGRKYFDTFSSLVTSILGHGNQEIAEVIAAQIKELEFFPNIGDTFTLPLINLANKLAEIAPGELKVSFFVNSGSEANETAIKLARQYFWEKGQQTKYKIIARHYSYHGTTLGAISATGFPYHRRPFEPLLPGFIFAPSANCFHCEFGLEPTKCNLLCAKTLEQLIEWEGPGTIAGIIMDPIPGSNSGYPIPPDGYLERVSEMCNKHNILLIFDEVQTGIAKTGKWFACEHWNIVPDILTIGKAITSAYLPLGVTMTTPEIYSVFRKPGSEVRCGSTFGGHSASCVAALKTLEIIERKNLISYANHIGSYIEKRLREIYEKYPIVGNFRGIGTLWALELLKDRKTKTPFPPALRVGNRVRDYCWEKGMILRNNADILVIAPSIIITEEEVEQMLGLMEEAIKMIMKEV
ncbi:MAG TPA: aspartate aminotransferase family protein [Candidatus Ratteibacteria bacterium]|nr:aspartate aminotransferase family protein [Candidatus Ratteibacteria bacterium]